MEEMVMMVMMAMHTSLEDKHNQFHSNISSAPTEAKANFLSPTKQFLKSGLQNVIFLFLHCSTVTDLYCNIR